MNIQICLLEWGLGHAAISGYTTIMELISLKCSALLIPTPGHTKQEYFAEYLEA